MIRPSLLVTCVLLTAVTASAQQASTPATSLRKTTDSRLGFSVVLVLGDLQTNPSSDAVPAGARAALNDMKDFLPYKSYRLLDTAWILGSSGRPATSRLRGPDERDYEVTLSGQQFPNMGVQVRFVLREPGTDRAASDAHPRQQEVAAQINNIQAQRQALEAEINALRQKLGELHPEIKRRERDLGELRKRLADLELHTPRTSGDTLIIDTGFRMEVGETVVVGTSRVRGDKALIALLTAVPRNK